jgi:acetyltransferase-like isoleucine patch superfamily enzyme
MSARKERLPKLARGLAFRRHRAVVGGERLMVSGRISISTPHRGAKVVLGERVVLSKRVKMFLDSPEARIEIGAFTGINRRTEIAAKNLVRIGCNCAIGWDVCITDTDYHEFENSDRAVPVIIGDDVWIGARATILKGVTIGSGAVIGAGAIITRDVPERALVVAPRSEVVRREVSWRF